MAFTDHHPPRWGCIVGPAIIIPLAFLWLLVGAMGGGGCEGDPNPNCVEDYTPMWIGFAVLAVTGFGIALGINRVLKWRFDRSR
jgi:hypothetical protein